MKLICERDVLHRAITAVIGRARGKTKIVILQHLKLEATDNLLSIAATDLDTRSDASCAAEVERAGSRCVPAERLAQIVAGLPSGTQISLQIKNNELCVQSGQSRYRIPTIAAEDFPEAWEPQNPVKFSLGCLDVKALFGEPLPAITIDGSRRMLEGAYLHQRSSSTISSVATDGKRFVQRSVTSLAGLTRGYIIPKSAMTEIVRLAHNGHVDLVLADNMISAASGSVTYCSKLIEADYPPVDRHIPALQGDSLLIDRAEFAAALKRLMSLELEYSRVRLSWGPNGLDIEITGDGSGQEHIGCECDSPGSLAFKSAILAPMVDAIKGDVIRIYPRGATQIMRMHDASDETLIVMAFPIGDGQADRQPQRLEATEDA